MKEHITYQQNARLLLEAERQEILRRYGVRSSAELWKRIEDRTVSEHPAWENYIELVHIEKKLEQLELPDKEKNHDE